MSIVDSIVENFMRYTLFAQWKVEQFHAKFGRPIGKFVGDNWDDEGQRALRARLVLEEACEFVEACGFHPEALMIDLRKRLDEQRGVHPQKVQLQPEPNFPEAVDALADLQYVTFGSGVTFGVDLGRPFDLVHEANMQKSGGGTDSDGKILKPPGWQPPDIEGLLAQMWSEQNP